MENQQLSIYTKLLKVKKVIGKVSKDSSNPFFKSKYFDINSLLENCEPLLQENGLLLLQPIINNKVISKIIDVSTGSEIESEIELPTLSDPQKLGSAITYYRRYTLQSLLGIQAEDDDANAATQQVKNQKITWLSEEQFKLAINSDAKGVKATLNSFSTDEKKMKKEYRQELEDRLKAIS